MYPCIFVSVSFIILHDSIPSSRLRLRDCSFVCLQFLDYLLAMAQCGVIWRIWRIWRTLIYSLPSEPINPCAPQACFFRSLHHWSASFTTSQPCLLRTECSRVPILNSRFDRQMARPIRRLRMPATDRPTSIWQNSSAKEKRGWNMKTVHCYLVYSFCSIFAIVCSWMLLVPS